jgi:hypothetical protein
MLQLKSLVEQYFPKEKVIFKEQVIFTDSWTAKLGKLPVSAAKQWYLKPIDMIETDKKYYFDRRQSYLFQSKLSLLINPIASFVFLYILFSIFLTKVTMPAIIVIFVLSIVVDILSAIWNVQINQGLVNILTIKKEWVKNKKSENGETILEGEIPEDDTGYSFAHFLTQEQVNKMSLNDKLFSGRFLGNLRNMVSARFTFKYKQAS